MPTLTKNPKASHRKPANATDGPPVRLKSWSELEEDLAKHLKPVRRGPKGQPIYAQKDLEALNIILPDQD
jgi:hypothetical protein